MRQVVISGVGIVSPIGSDKNAFLEGLRSGRSGVERIRAFGIFPERTAARVADLEAKVLEHQSLPSADRLVQMARISAEEAVSDAGLNLPATPRERVGLAFGTSNGLSDGFLDYYRGSVGEAKLIDILNSGVAGAISGFLGLKGPAMTFVTACTAGANAIGYGMDLIRAGQCDVVLAGGGDILSPIVVSGFMTLDALAAERCKPFCIDREGLTLGEGCAWVVIEALEHALARNASFYAELCGYGLSNDAHHATAPDPDGDGAVRAMRAALRDAGITSAEVDYINAHGTATQLNDAMELHALQTVFWNHLPPVSASKSQFGHALGGAGALEAVATVLAVKHQFVPPTLNCLTPMSPDVDFVPNMSRSHLIRHAMSNSFGFGGNTAALVFGAVRGEP